MNAELISLERAAEIGLETKTSDRLFVHPRIEHLESRASLLFCAVERQVGAAQHVLRMIVRITVDGDPETHRRERFILTNANWCLQRRLQPLRDARRVARLANVLEEKRELVAAEAGEHVQRAKTAGEPSRYFEQ